MKRNYLMIASALLFSVIAFAQKDQIKAAEKALKNGNSQEAISILNNAVVSSSVAEKAQFLFVKGNAYLDLANKKVDESKNLLNAAKSYQDLLETEKTSGNDKYSSQVSSSIYNIKNRLLNSAIDDTKSNKILEGAQKMYDAYLLDKNDTINLYYAATTYVSGKDYVSSLKCYNELKALNFSGKGTVYSAKNKLNDQEDVFNSAKERDLAIKIGTHEKPRKEVLPSKRGEINKNIALILVQQGKVDEAKKAVSDARKANPNDDSLILTEANLYLETKDFVTYKNLVDEALSKNPNDANLLFNLGVISAQSKNVVDAEKYYKRAIEVDPKYTNAYINLAALKLEGEKAIIDEMNKLGTTEKDNKRYNVLKTKREDLFKSIIPFLEKAVDLDSNSIELSKTLLNVYSALEMMDKVKPLKLKIKELEAKK